MSCYTSNIASRFCTRANISKAFSSRCYASQISTVSKHIFERCRAPTVDSSLHQQRYRSVKRSGLRTFAAVTTMTIKEGERVPDGVFMVKSTAKDPPHEVKTQDFFSGKKVVLFGLPGAYTTVCSQKQLPQYVAKYDELQGEGVDTIGCLSVNDAFVMYHWGNEHNVGDHVMMLGDGDASWVNAAGLAQELPRMGTRARRFSLYAEDGVVKILNVDEAGPMSYKVSGPDHMLQQLKELKSKQ